MIKDISNYENNSPEMVEQHRVAPFSVELSKFYTSKHQVTFVTKNGDRGIIPRAVFSLLKNQYARNPYWNHTTNTYHVKSFAEETASELNELLFSGVITFDETDCLLVNQVALKRWENENKIRADLGLGKSKSVLNNDVSSNTTTTVKKDNPFDVASEKKDTVAKTLDTDNLKKKIKVLYRMSSLTANFLYDSLVKGNDTKAFEELINYGYTFLSMGTIGNVLVIFGDDYVKNCPRWDGFVLLFDNVWQPYYRCINKMMKIPPQKSPDSNLDMPLFNNTGVLKEKISYLKSFIEDGRFYIKIEDGELKVTDTLEKKKDPDYTDEVSDYLLNKLYFSRKTVDYLKEKSTNLNYNKIKERGWITVNHKYLTYTIILRPVSTLKEERVMVKGYGLHFTKQSWRAISIGYHNNSMKIENILFNEKNTTRLHQLATDKSSYHSAEQAGNALYEVYFDSGYTRTNKDGVYKISSGYKYNIPAENGPQGLSLKELRSEGIIKIDSWPCAQFYACVGEKKDSVPADNVYVLYSPASNDWTINYYDGEVHRKVIVQKELIRALPVNVQEAADGSGVTYDIAKRLAHIFYFLFKDMKGYFVYSSTRITFNINEVILTRDTAVSTDFVLESQAFLDYEGFFVINRSSSGRDYRIVFKRTGTSAYVQLNHNNVSNDVAKIKDLKYDSFYIIGGMNYSPVKELAIRLNECYKNGEIIYKNTKFIPNGNVSTTKKVKTGKAFANLDYHEKVKLKEFNEFEGVFPNNIKSIGLYNIGIKRKGSVSYSTYISGDENKVLAKFGIQEYNSDKGYSLTETIDKCREINELISLGKIQIDSDLYIVSR